MILKRLFGKPLESTPQRLYGQIVAQARQPWLYAEAGVPDTVEGRFEMIVLHAFLVIERLGGEGETARELAQQVFDEMFMDMDSSLREMGVGDLAVGPRIKQMAQAFYGRSRAYRQALGEGGASERQALIAALSRNVFAGFGGADAAALADYVLDLRRGLGRQPVSELLAGQAGFGSAVPA